jgi:hypothetical protein
MTIAADNPPASGWWHRALTDGSTLGYAATAAGCLIALGLVLWRWRVTQRGGPSAVSDANGEAGTATIEFTLAFPIVMFLVLLLLQVTWAMVGNLFVHYAAFSATRSAIVYIPWDAPQVGEPRNTITVGDGEKFDRIQRAASFSLIPVAGESESGEAAAEEFTSALRTYYQKSGPRMPGWVESQAAGRARYAMAHTEVTLMRTNNSGSQASFDPIRQGRATFGSREPISVRVRHRLDLAVPYVSVIFADGEHDTAEGTRGYTNVTARYTLTNEGVSDALPDRPELPRKNEPDQDEDNQNEDDEDEDNG